MTKTTSNDIQANTKKTRITGKKNHEANFKNYFIIPTYGRSDWLGYWDEFVQKARFKKLACLCHIKQNDLTYLGRVCAPCLSVSTGIYGLSIKYII